MVIRLVRIILISHTFGTGVIKHTYYYKEKIDPPLYRMAHEKPAHCLVDQRACRSRTLYRKLNKCECKERSVVAAFVYIQARSRRLEMGRFFVEDLKENIWTEIRRIDTAETVG